jgi:hypothetical protein
VLSYKNRGTLHLFALASASIVAGVSALAACSDSTARQCRVGADCTSGVCASDGTCAVAAVPPGGPDGGPPDDAMSPPDGGGSETSTDAAVSGCSPNKDGTITRDEVPIAAGLHATYKIGSKENVDTHGVDGADGKRVWDYSAALGSDVSVLVETLPLTGKWYAGDYPGATYATKLSNSSDLLGIFETAPGSLLLRGVVSPASDAATKTELTNTPAVSVLAFPLKLTAKWNTNTNVGGTAQGTALFGTYTEAYTSEVDAEGTLKTPLGTFDVLRVKTVLVRTIGLLPSETYRTFAFVTECYGTIATVSSVKNETNVEFTYAAEIRRISP